MPLYSARHVFWEEKNLYTKKFRPLCLSLLALGFFSCSKVSASCYEYPGLPTNMSSPSVKINPDVPTGAVAGQYTLSWSGLTDICGPVRFARVHNEYTTAQQDFAGQTLFPTNIYGLSYRMRISQGAFSGTANYEGPSYFWNGQTVTAPPGSATIELVKTGPIDSGGQLQSVGYRMMVTSDGSSVQGGWYLTGSLNPVIVVPSKTCTITRSSIPVSLDEAETRELAKKGNTTKEKSFIIPINCPSSRSLSLQFSGTMADSTNGVFKNLKSGSNNATTLGIQILRGGTPVKPSTNYNIGIITGNANIGMSARYYALADSVAAGDIQSVAYATIIYN